MSENVINSESTSDPVDGHTADGHHAHPKPKYDDVNIPVVVLIGVFSAILTFVSIAFVQGLYYSWQESIVQADWNSRILTPQEKTIVDQKQIRDGFYETRDGKVYVSAEVAARKLMGTGQQTPSPENKGDENAPKTSGKPASKPEPPGPDPEKAAEKKSPEPKKESPESNSKEKNPPKTKDPVTSKDAKTGDNK